MTEKTLGKLIHIGRIQEQGSTPVYLFLRQEQPQLFQWFKETANGHETETSVKATTIEEALFLAQRFWKNNSFRTVICGFRYTLPERDEHGTNALFYQLAASFSSMSGVYFEEELGHNCIVHNPSLEARSLFDQLKAKKRL